MYNVYFNYAVIRFLPYRDRGEFINIGIVIHGNDGSFSTRIVDAGYPRVDNVFPLLSAGLFAQHLKPLKRELSRIEALASNRNIDAQQQLFKNLTEPGEGVFTYSPSGTLAAKDPQAALDELFNRYVHHDVKHVASPEEQLTKDVTHWLKSLNRRYTEQTLGNDIVRVKLPFVWQEGSHIRQAIKPISFDLDDASKIIEKGDKWLAHLRRLKISGHTPDDMVFISQAPKVQKGPKLQAYREICQEIEGEYSARVLPEQLGQHSILKAVSAPLDNN